MIGTVTYLAPEMLRPSTDSSYSDGSADGRKEIAQLWLEEYKSTDIWALACEQTRGGADPGVVINCFRMIHPYSGDGSYGVSESMSTSSVHSSGNPTPNSKSAVPDSMSDVHPRPGTDIDQDEVEETERELHPSAPDRAATHSAILQWEQERAIEEDEGYPSAEQSTLNQEIADWEEECRRALASYERFVVGAMTNSLMQNTSTWTSSQWQDINPEGKIRRAV